MNASQLSHAEALLVKRKTGQESSIFPTGRTSHASVIEALCRACDCLRQIDQRSRLFVDRDGRWLASDKLAEERLICGASGLVIAHGRLQANGALAPQLKKLLEVQAEPVTAVLSKARGEGHVILRSVAFDEDVVCIEVKDVDGSLEADFAGLEDAFGLTPAETKVVTMMLSGHSAAEVAAERGLSINTVRAHLRHCYEKLGVSSREQLWCKMYPFQMQ